MLHRSLMKTLRMKKKIPPKKQIPHIHKLKQKWGCRFPDPQIIGLQKHSITNETCKYPLCWIHSRLYLENHQEEKWWRHLHKMHRSEHRPTTPGRITSNSIRKCAPIGNRGLGPYQTPHLCKSGHDRDHSRLTLSLKWWMFHQTTPTMGTKKWKKCHAEILYQTHRNIHDSIRTNGRG